MKYTLADARGSKVQVAREGGDVDGPVVEQERGAPIQRDGRARRDGDIHAAEGHSTGEQRQSEEQSRARARGRVTHGIYE